MCHLYITNHQRIKPRVDPSINSCLYILQLRWMYLNLLLTNSPSISVFFTHTLSLLLCLCLSPLSPNCKRRIIVLESITNEKISLKGTLIGTYREG